MAISGDRRLQSSYNLGVFGVGMRSARLHPPFMYGSVYINKNIELLPAITIGTISCVVGCKLRQRVFRDSGLKMFVDDVSTHARFTFRIWGGLFAALGRRVWFQLAFLQNSL